MSTYLRVLAAELAFVGLGVAVGALVFWTIDRIRDARVAWRES